jgi:hypothetical protein
VQITVIKKWKCHSWSKKKVSGKPRLRKVKKGHTQLVLWTTKELKNASLEWSDLTNARGNKISAKSVSSNFVRYERLIEGIQDFKKI